MKTYLIRLSIICALCFLSQTAFADLAQNYYKRGVDEQSLDEKLKYFSITLKLDPNFSDALIAKAETLFQMSNLDAAQTDVDEYLAKYPGTARALTLRGNLAQRRGQWIKAEEDFDNALKLDPKHDEANFRKGMLLIVVAKLKSDAKVFEKAVGFFKNVPDKSFFYEAAISQAARCMEHLSKFGATEALYQTLTQKAPDNASYFFHLGRLQYMSDQYVAATSSIDKACDLTFKDKSLKVFYGLFRYFLASQKLKDETSAAYQLSRFLDKLPESLLGKLFQGKITDQEYLDQTLRLEANKKLSDKRRQSLSCEIYCHLGYYFLLKNKPTEAFEAFGRAIDKSIFGLEFYSMAKFEHQKLLITQEVNEQPAK